uniref:Chloride channel protein n=1 Tax=Pseudo-nitzschia australis TaxID=44445 RepID=A0A6U9VP36_9STRA|mmetsp:Transcript_2015/g.4329  ORF Transcript_2015/g.4329 Transcript_2015/m.4329 type:complete len:571 (-) Transcript_2015:194-1906(-)
MYGTQILPLFKKGGGFCKAFGNIKKASSKRFNTKGLKMIRISYISLVNSIVMFLLPMMSWVCKDGTSQNAEAAEQQFNCEIGQTNQMATIFFGSRGKAIVRILSNPSQFYASTLAIVGSVFYVLMLYTNTTSIPSGLFTPIVISGASLGGALGVWLQENFDENIDPSTFALLGVGAMMAGIQRSTVSTCVILVEGTGQMRILLPVMIVVVISNYIAQFIHKDGVYEVLVKLKGFPYLSHDVGDCYDVFTVRAIMNSPPITVREKERAFRLVEILRNSTHNGFPVINAHGHFKGLVRRKQIVALMECGIFEKVGPGDDAVEESIRTSASWVGSCSSKEGKGLMNFAYHIKDDRYNHVVEEVDVEERNTAAKWKDAVKQVGMILKENKRRLGGDITMPMVDVSKLDTSNFLEHDDFDAGIDGGGDDVESDGENDQEVDDIARVSYYKAKKSSSNDNDNTTDIMLRSTEDRPMKGFARVGMNPKTNVVVLSWLNSDNKNDVVDLAAVMNRGAFSVTEDFPVSKAYTLFTLLGLRWIVVVGGPDGSTVVGLLTRESFIASNLKEKTEVDTRAFQ